jgi:transcriptional regulator with XRE-family HTH domain
MSEAAIGRMAGASRATANRWARGTHRPDHDSVQRLAARVYIRFPQVARELVEASGYAWSVPADAPEPDVLAEEFGEENAARLRRVFEKRGETGQAALRALIEVLSSPAADAEGQDESRPSRAAG